MQIIHLELLILHSVCEMQRFLHFHHTSAPLYVDVSMITNPVEKLMRHGNISVFKVNGRYLEVKCLKQPDIWPFRKFYENKRCLEPSKQNLETFSSYNQMETVTGLIVQEAL